MSVLLIDAHGDIWSAHSRELRAAYDSPFSGGEFTSYAIRNMGFVGLHQFGNSCHLMLSATFVTEKALAACFEWITHRPFARYVLSLNGDERMGLFGTMSELFRAVESAVSKAHRATVTDYLAEPEQRFVKPPIVELHEALTQGPIDLASLDPTSKIARLIKRAFGERYVVARTDSERSRLVFQSINGDLFSAYPDWRARAAGMPVNLLPDPTYGDWVAQSYFRALDRQAPVAEKIDAIIRWPHAGKQRTRYRRIILPFGDPSGAPQLISGTADDVNIDLRIKRA